MKTFVCSTIFFLTAASGFGLPPVVETPSDDPRQPTLTFASPALGRGLAPDNTDEELAVWLPPSYFSSPGRRYPVVYTLHGYGDNVDQVISVVAPLLEGFSGPEFIMVGVAGGLSFYVDSPVRGDVAQMIVNEVVPLVDSRFRTIPQAQGRLLAGSSMGGFGAWTLGLARPDLFAGVWACCPGAFDKKGLRDAVGQWRSGIFSDYATTFAPQFLDAGRAPLPGSTEPRGTPLM